MAFLNKHKLLAALVVLFVATTAVFVLAGRLVGASFPAMPEALGFFEEKETQLNAYVRRLAEDQVEKVACYPDRVVVEGSEAPLLLDAEQRLEYLELCRGTENTWRVDDGYLVLLGGETKRGRDFFIALVWRGPDRYLCSEVAGLGDIGNCSVPLRNGWALNYEWRSSDFDSPREKELMELAEDAAEDSAS